MGAAQKMTLGILLCPSGCDFQVPRLPHFPFFFLFFLKKIVSSFFLFVFGHAISCSAGFTLILTEIQLCVYVCVFVDRRSRHILWRAGCATIVSFLAHSSFQFLLRC